MNAPGPILGDAVAPPSRKHRRAPDRGRDGGSETISTLAEAEHQIVSAARDLAHLAGELARVTSESEQRGSALIEAREECARVSRRLTDLEMLAVGVKRRITAERAAADARVREAQEQAAAAIRMAEERASAALLAAHESVSAVATAHEAAVERALGAEQEIEAQREDVAARQTVAERELAAARELALTHEAEAAAARAAAAEREAGPQETALERRLGAELEHLRRERSEHEERLRAELDRARAEKLELRTRLSMCEHALGEREADLQRERQLADEAMRWASSVERELVLPPPAAAPAAPPTGDCAVKPPADPPTAVRRRGSRVRLRAAG